MIVLSKLDALRKQPEQLARYNDAVIILKELGIDQVLLELAVPDDLPLGHPEAATIALQQLGVAVGYKQCLHDLFSLDRSTFGEQRQPIADFGADQKVKLNAKQRKEIERGKI